MTDPTPELHEYQKVAVDFLRHQDIAGLFLDMGLGKTAVTLTALTPDHLPALVVAPKRVAHEVWPTETALWRPDLRCEVASGRADARERALTSGADIVAISRDSLAHAVPHADRFKTLVIDELSGFKNRASQRWKMANKIRARVSRCWGLTGTPSPQGLMDLWAQMALLDRGARLGKTLTGFRSRYFIPGRRLPTGIITEWIPLPEAEPAIHRLLEDICLSMATDGRVDLPPVTYNYVSTPLSPQDRQLYKKLKRDLVVDLEMLGGELHTASNAAVLSGKLSQLSAGFMYHDDADLRGGTYDVIHHTKVSAVREVVEGTGSPVLVFYRYAAERDMLLAELGSDAHTIDEPDIQARWNAGQIPILLAHPASAGHGLNLQKGPGHTMVWTSLPWSLEEWLQANKRLARQGQKNPVVIHVLETPHTIDGRIAEVLAGKATVQDALRAHLESPL